VSGSLAVWNPATGERLAEIEVDDPATIAAKVARARAAQAGWARRPLAERLAVLAAFRSRVIAERDVLATLLTREVGKPITQSRSELDGLVPRIDFFLAATEAALRDEWVHDADGVRERIEHAALGVVANVSAWNYPWFVGCNVLLPALAAGNAVVYKPSEFATLTGQAIVRLLHESGVPVAALQLVAGRGDAGATLCDQPIDGLFFTGSHATGQRIATTLSPRLVKVQLELGGKDPSYVRADADATVAAESLADGAMYNTGQSCCAVERIYVDARIHDAFVARFVAAVDRMRCGDPMDPATGIGAITRRAQLDVLEHQVADAVARGARLLRGGHRLPGPGNGFEPTVLVDVDHGMAVMRDESFGPIIGIQRVAGDEEAVALMNDSRFGLTAGIYSRDEARSLQLLARLQAGSVYWNCCDRVSPRLPWSGWRDSGIGLTLSSHGIRTFTRPRAWHLKGAG
jgi:acyl-CoA reductase-like NAD-dependent aldehyde dehydrogenase